MKPQQILGFTDNNTNITTANKSNFIENLLYVRSFTKPLYVLFPIVHRRYRNSNLGRISQTERYGWQISV